MVVFAYYFAAHRAKYAWPSYRGISLFSKALGRYGRAELVFRYKHEYFEKAQLGGAGTYFLYDHLRRLSKEDVARMERDYLPPYNTLRMMTITCKYRYPDISGMPDDYWTAQVADAWVRFFRERKPDVFVGGLMDDYVGIVGQEIAKRMGITVVLIMAAGVFSGQYTLCGPDYLPLFYKKFPEKEVAAACRKAVEGLTGTGVMNKSIKNIFGRYYDFASVKNVLFLIGAFFSSVKWYYFNSPKVERKLWLSPFELIARQTKYFIRSTLSRLVFREKPQKGERYVFFPLHFTDDAAIVMALPFANQIEMTKELARVLPHGVKLYIKPHPHWRCADIKLSDMLELRKIPNMRRIDTDVNAKELIKGSEFTVVINSSVGFESLALKKKVYSFGNFYPPEIIPRLTSPRDVLKLRDKDLDWGRVRDFLGRIYLHGIRSDERDYAVGAFNEDLTQRLAREINDYYRSVKGG